jgi:hypothetical protein
VPEVTSSVQSPTRPRKRRLAPVPDSEEEWDEESEVLEAYNWSELDLDPAEINGENDSKKLKLDAASHGDPT